MEFRIADTFTDSLARLNGDEQKAVKTTAFDLQMSAASPGMAFHKLEKSKDKNFWSVRVTSDIRLIVHRSDDTLLLCYVDHHDKAYDWAERRKLETHPKTGAAQLVEIRETVKEIVLPVYVEAKPSAPPKEAETPARPFANYSADQLLAYGVPAEWLEDVRAASDESILEIAEHLPAEAAEALLEIATGGTPRIAQPTAPLPSPFEHPDAQRRFRVVANVEELQAALDAPWEKWTIFLHPEQRQWVEREFNGPARVAGSAGTGKTIVALHRAVDLARNNADARVLLATFSDPLANALRLRLRRLLAGTPRLGERIDVSSIDEIGLRLYKNLIKSPALVTRQSLRDAILAAARALPGQSFTSRFLLTEWDQVVDAWNLRSWEEYRDVARLGRKTRLPEAQRMLLWSIFSSARADLAAKGVITMAEVFHSLAAFLAKTSKSPFDFAVIDESQDLSVAQLRFLAALGHGRPASLFFAGDLGQRIFQQPFSWKSLGVDIRGRSRTLRVNYRTSHQIRTQADRLLGPAVSDVDGNIEDRSDAISVFNGPAPVIRSFPNKESEAAAVAVWIKDRVDDGLLPHELGVFVRSEAQLPRALLALEQSQVAFRVLDEHLETASGQASVSTMHLAKGLEFRAVVVMACDDEVLPLQERIESVGDDADLAEVYESERSLLYVACTRARESLLVTCVEPGSEFLDDMGGKPR